MHGAISFDRFMELALYHPAVGYYSWDAAGPGAEHDYLTSPEIHSVFALLICVQLVEMWDQLGSPDPFWLIEAGPGSGAFAADVLNAAGVYCERFAAALRVALIEPSPILRRRQAERLGTRVSWLDPDPTHWTALGPGCVFANEVFDALPVHRIVGVDGGLQELYVGLVEGRLVDEQGPLSDPAIHTQMASGGGQLTVGQRGEVNLAAPRLVRSLARLVHPGYLLLMDYGDPAATLYGSRHPDGTLRCYSRHRMSRDPFQDVGKQDMTTHVDLTAVTGAAEHAGLALIGATRQARLLARLGIHAAAGPLQSGELSLVEQRAHRAAFELLMDPRELGRLAVLGFATRGAPLALRGFSDGEALTQRFPPALLQTRSDAQGLARSVGRGHR